MYVQIGQLDVACGVPARIHQPHEESDFEKIVIKNRQPGPEERPGRISSPQVLAFNDGPTYVPHMKKEVLRLRQRLIFALADLPDMMRISREVYRTRLRKPALDWPELLFACLPTQIGRDRIPWEEAPNQYITTILDNDYPRLLRHIPDPPLLLYVKGSRQAMHRPAVAIVGARSCTQYGRNTARQLAAELARLGFVTVSGLALGIDAAVHAATVSIQGRTVAVLGNGLDHIYPRGHEALAETIIDQGGALVSEFPPGTPALPRHFPIRNRLISGFSHAVIVVEAKKRSGSLITARHCLDQGRELFAVPGPIYKSTAAGPNHLISSGQAKLLSSVASLLEELKPLLGLAVNQANRKKTVIADPLARKIYDMLDAFEPMPVDCIAAGLDIAAGKAVAKLTELESLKLVEKIPGQFFLRNPLDQPSLTEGLRGNLVESDPVSTVPPYINGG